MKICSSPRVKAIRYRNSREPSILKYTMSLSLSTYVIEPDITVVTLAGKMTLGRDGSFEAIVSTLVAEGARKVVFDLSELGYIDSSGIGQLIHSVTSLNKAGGSCRVAGTKGLVRSVFHITRVDTVIAFTDTLAEACASLSA